MTTTTSEIPDKDKQDLLVLAKELRYAKHRRELEVAELGLHWRRVKTLVDRYGHLLARVAGGEISYVSAEYGRSGSKQPFQIGSYGRAIYLPARLEW